MQKLRILNTKERKELIKKLESEYDATLSAKDLEVLRGDSEYFITTRECLSLNLEGLRIDSIGLRLAVETKNGAEPTVHAIQLLYQKSGKTIMLDEEQAKGFIRNQEIESEKPDGQYLITRKNKPIDAGRVKNKRLSRGRA